MSPEPNLNLTENDYRWIGEQLSGFARKNCDGRVISVLEGGYNHKALAASIIAYLEPFTTTTNPIP